EGIRSCSALMRDHDEQSLPPIRYVVAERVLMPDILPSLVAPLLDSVLLEQYRDADGQFFLTGANRGFTRDGLRTILENAGLHVIDIVDYRHEAKRSIGDREISLWTSEASPYGAYILKNLGSDGMDAIRDALYRGCREGTVLWPSAWTICLAR
ncbi:MAG: hypothetical protein JXM71_08775, partial [Spirochaetales bacterium]|nr:hypothetical protein [Spirochaetales bacterium]